jgi:hypothetical protein
VYVCTGEPLWLSSDEKINEIERSRVRSPGNQLLQFGKNILKIKLVISKECGQWPNVKNVMT